MIRALRLDDRECVSTVNLPQEQWEKLLASGCPPTPGAREVVAGYLCRLETFRIDAQTFRVVGRFQAGIPGVGFLYALPEHPSIQSHFSDEAGGKLAWLDPAGLPRLEASGLAPQPEGTRIAGTIGRASPAVTVGCLIGLALTTLGGVVLWLHLFRWLAWRLPALPAALFREMEQHRALSVSMHALLYGLFFVGMAAALAFPLAQTRVTQYLQGEFEAGTLSFIGEAYEARHILRASAVTWLWNFCVATVALTILPSLLIPFWGLLKNLATFLFVGFAAAPTWIGAASTMVTHSLTLVLEMEGYVVACFTVTLYAIYILVGLWNRAFSTYSRRGAALIESGTVVAGLILALAATYEAATLILFH